MSNATYNLHLKGFVGGADFDRNYLDFVLAQNSEQSVFVLIDSPGDSLPTALSMPRRYDKIKAKTIFSSQKFGCLDLFV